MPLIKQAIKKMRRDKVATQRNSEIKDTVKKAVKAVRKNPTKKSLDSVFSILDKAAKRKFIHINKASRLKSRLTKLVK